MTRKPLAASVEINVTHTHHNDKPESFHQRGTGAELASLMPATGSWFVTDIIDEEDLPETKLLYSWLSVTRPPFSI
ncbi:hypothetical protein E5288_WYG002602 [Bos mutus]|uniref:Uncharacterized protein n=1 Tax=Bos mutus TaxID=72004 RepID=A0A6B0R145_9CETA|nr:hypothetical protein [Bos mutus]